MTELEARMIKTKQLIIVGIGETANMAHEYFEYDSAYSVIGFCVSKAYLVETQYKGLPVLVLEDLPALYPPGTVDLFVALGSGALNYHRTHLYQHVKAIGYTCASYISSKAFVWRNVEIGENCFILEQNVLQAFSRIGDNVTLWSGNHIGHQSVIKDNCFITSHVVISGFCEVGENSFVGVNACVADHIKIARDNYIAMGAVINKNTQENAIYKGNPSVKAMISAKDFCSVME